MKNMFKTVLFVTVISVMLTSCNKKEVCKSYAPADKEISWTDYNTISEVYDYFGCYKETAAMHYGDTMKVMGYIIPWAAQGITRPFDYESHIYPAGRGYGSSVNLLMADYYDVPHNKQHFLVLCGYNLDEPSNNAEAMSKFQNYQWGQKVYATVIIQGRSKGDGSCCDYQDVKPIEVEIENMEDKK